MQWAHRNRCVHKKMTNQEPKHHLSASVWETGSSAGNMFKRPPDTPRLYIHPHTLSHTHAHTLIRLQSMAHLHHSPHHSFTHSSPAWLSATEPHRSSYFIADLLKPGGRALVCVELCSGGQGQRRRWWRPLSEGFSCEIQVQRAERSSVGGAHTDNTAVTQPSLMLPTLAWRYSGNVNKRDRPLALLWFLLMDCLLYLMFCSCGPIENNLFQSKTNR